MRVGGLSLISGVSGFVSYTVPCFVIVHKHLDVDRVGDRRSVGVLLTVPPWPCYQPLSSTVQWRTCEAAGSRARARSGIYSARSPAGTT